MTTLMKFSVVIPLFNEAKNISLLVEEILNSLDKKKYDFEIILIDDKSNDNTLNVIKSIGDKYNFVKTASNDKNLGQSFSIINGVKISKHQTIVTIDGDGQNNPSDIPTLIESYFSSKEIYLVGGIREKRKDSLIKIASSKIANKIRNWILKDECEDTGCALKVFDKQTFLKFPEFRGLHRFIPAFFKHYNKKMIFLKVDHRERKRGKSNYGTFERLIYGIIDLVRVLKIINKND